MKTIILKEFKIIREGFIEYVAKQLKKDFEDNRDEYENLYNHSFKFEEYSFTFKCSLYFDFYIHTNAEDNIEYNITFECHRDNRLFFNTHWYSVRDKDISMLLTKIKDKIQIIKDEYGIFISPVVLFVDYLEEYTNETARKPE